MDARLIRWGRAASSFLERVVAVAILVGIVCFTVASARALAAMDWRATETFYEMIYRVLVVVIAIELVRTLVTHDLGAILELLAFVVARKILKPDVTAADIVLCVAAFVALVAARTLLVPRDAPAEPGRNAPG